MYVSPINKAQKNLCDEFVQLKESSQKPSYTLIYYEDTLQGILGRGGGGSIFSEEFELIANSLGAHIETHGTLILRTLSYLTVNSLDDSHCELSVSLLLTL